MKPYGIRDKIVYAIANTVLRLASRRYQQTLRGVWIYGLQAATRDQAREGK